VPRTRPSPPLRTALRKTVKWGGAVVTGLLFVVWSGGIRYHAGWRIGGGETVAVSAGQIRYKGFDSIGGPEPHREVGYYAIVDKPRLWFDWGNWGFGPYLAIPLWPAVLLSLLTTAAAWRADSKYLLRARAGLCPACNYNRAGLAAGAVCPECGTPAPPLPASSPPLLSPPAPPTTPA